MAENFRPVLHSPPDNFFNKIKYFTRFFLDLQFHTILRHLKPLLKGYKGMVLDIGAGNGPFRHLLSKDTKYQGLDINRSESFDYNNSEIIHYDGHRMPFEDASFDHFICTEVLEHVAEPEMLISETYRIIKPGGSGVFTIPWSARFHYQPYDYYRYTPSMLNILFKNFRSVTILPRGTDIASIASKIIVIYFRCLTEIVNNFRLLKAIINICLLIILLPVLILVIPIGLLGSAGVIGSDDDPLGYTVILKK